MLKEEAKPSDAGVSQSHLVHKITAATSLTVVLSAVAYQTIPVSRLAPLDKVASRLAFTLQWNALTVAVIYVMVIVIGRQRFLFTHHQNPVAAVDADHDKVQVHARVLQNTLEQFVMSFVSQLVLSTWLDASQMMIIPIIVVLFVVGRIIFWIGYLNPAHNRTDRALGLPMSWFPTMCMIAFNIYKLVISTFCCA